MKQSRDLSLPVWPEGVSLLLGLGAQKAGTTWLHDHLRAHPDCHAFPIKETHYFDTISGQTRLGYLLTSRRMQALSRQGETADLERVTRLAALLEAPDAAHQGYVDLMTAGLRPGSVALDITPSYALLDERQFAHLGRMDPLRFLFILREPVSRFWSNIRMMVNWRGQGHDHFEPAARDLVDHALKNDGERRLASAMARSEYATTLDKLARYVPANRRLVVFFEDLFTNRTINRIWAFLGLAPMPLTDTAPRLEGHPATMRADQIERLKEVFRPQYEAACAGFGDQVPPAWHARFAAGTVAA